jgi:hypothetical protein
MSIKAKKKRKFRRSTHSKKVQEGALVFVKGTHGSPKFRGDVGIVDKYIPFGKFYVDLKKNGRAVVSSDDLERIG